MPSWRTQRAPSQHFAFLLFDAFSNLCLANAVEPLRAANTIAGRTLYTWRFLTLTGACATSSSGMSVDPAAALSVREAGDALFVVASYAYRRHANAASSGALRRAAPRFGTLVGLDTGSWLLAHAGLLDGHTATIHWETQEAFAERFPEVDVLFARHVISGDRVTCGGGATALDLMLALIAAHHGEALALDVAGLFRFEDRHGPDAGDATGLARQGYADARPGDETPGDGEPIVARAITAMQDHIEEPLPIKTLARMTGTTQRGLETRFRRAFGATPRTVYQHIRLAGARRLLEETDLSIAEIAVRCGYGDPSALARAFKAHFGQSPTSWREAHRGPQIVRRAGVTQN